MSIRIQGCEGCDELIDCPRHGHAAEEERRKDAIEKQQSSWIQSYDETARNTKEPKTMNKFEYRFEGPNNAGLRAEIRRVVRDNPEASPLELEQAIMNISRRVALNLSGFHTLALVATDYARAATRGGNYVPGYYAQALEDMAYADDATRGGK